MPKNKEKFKLDIHFLYIFTFSICTALAFLFFIDISQASINQKINYQGQLLDTAGEPASSGNYDFTFNFYTVPTGGIADETSNQSVSVDEDGVFSASIDISSIEFIGDYYLGITVGTDTEMTPRKQVMLFPKLSMLTT